MLFSHLLVVRVAGTSDEGGPTFRMELEGCDAVPSVTFSRDLWSQDLQAVPGRKACNTFGVNSGRVSLQVDFTLCSPSRGGWVLLESFP